MNIYSLRREEMKKIFVSLFFCLLCAALILVAACGGRRRGFRALRFIDPAANCKSESLSAVDTVRPDSHSGLDHLECDLCADDGDTRVFGIWQ